MFVGAPRALQAKGSRRKRHGKARSHQDCSIPAKGLWSCAAKLRTLISPESIVPDGVVGLDFAEGLGVGLWTGFAVAFFGGTASVDSSLAGSFLIGFGVGLRFAGLAALEAALTGFAL